MSRQQRKLKKVLFYMCFIVILLFLLKTWKYCIKKHKIHKETNMKYILQWTDANTEPLKEMGIGQQGFIERRCTYTNCFVTSDRDLLGKYTAFDVIVFNGWQVRKLGNNQLPQERSPHQKYVFLSVESAANFPIVRTYFDDFFNWTWTYKLDSDLVWGYISIADMQGNVIGPKDTMHWIKNKEMLPVSRELRNRLQRKKKAVAWLVSHCDTINLREQIVDELNRELQNGYNLSIDIYGKCGSLECEDCDEMIKRDYYFYLAFENSVSEDYVTEKLSRALENYAIPIVYGGSNYSRFLPNHSYLDITNYSIMTLAKKIYKLINNFEKYVQYFKWTNHYCYYRKNHTFLTSNNFCEMCAFLNKENVFKNVSVYRKFGVWWNEWNYPSMELVSLVKLSKV